MLRARERAVAGCLRSSLVLSTLFVAEHFVIAAAKAIILHVTLNTQAAASVT